MNYAIQHNQFHINSIYYCDAIRNNIMDAGFFVHIFYSSQFFTLNGISLQFQLSNCRTEKYYSKYKCHFRLSGENNTQVIASITSTEKEILDKFTRMNKKYAHLTPQYKIAENLQNGQLKFLGTPATTMMQQQHYPPGIHHTSNGTSHVVPNWGHVGQHPHNNIYPSAVAAQSCAFVLKISGIWITETRYGLTFKFTPVPMSDIYAK